MGTLVQVQLNTFSSRMALYRSGGEVVFFQKSNIKKVLVSVSTNLVSKKVSVSVLKIWSKKGLSIGLENIESQKKSRRRSQKHLVSKKVSVLVSKIFGLKKVLVLVSNEIFGLVTQ